MNGRALPSRSRGAALLIAMLTVALVATFAAASLWQQWRSIEVEGAERARVQSTWVLTGALDWARLLLREDARSGAGDNLGEPWAVPLKEARLSSFLAADQNNTADSGPEVLEAFLSGQITDLQSFLNVNNLADKSRASEPDVRSFQRLFELLKLPPEQLDRLVENLRIAADPGAASQAQAPLAPQRVEELVWLGLPVSTIAALRPYVTLLPVHTSINLNTAGPEVIFAAMDGISMADAQRLVAERERSPFKSPEDAKRLITSPEATLANVQVVTQSNYFETRSRLRLDKLMVEERAMLLRNGMDVSVLQRERGIPDVPAPTQAASTR